MANSVKAWRSCSSENRRQHSRYRAERSNISNRPGSSGTSPSLGRFTGKAWTPDTSQRPQTKHPPVHASDEIPPVFFSHGTGNRSERLSELASTRGAARVCQQRSEQTSAPLSQCLPTPSGRLLRFDLVGTEVQFVRQFKQSSTSAVLRKHSGIPANRHRPGPHCGRSLTNIHWYVGTPRRHLLQPTACVTDRLI